VITKPFGAYVNVIDIDDVHFEDAFLSQGMKNKLAVTETEKNINYRFNQITGHMGLRETPWGKASIIMYAIWTMVTSFICFEKPDFLNVSTQIN